MNLVVRPDGTAELDERAADDVLAEAWPLGTFATINVTVDNGHTIVTRVRYDPSSEEVTQLATRVMLHLTGHHFFLLGQVIFTELDPTLAHELLELARD